MGMVAAVETFSPHAYVDPTPDQATTRGVDLQ